MTKYLPPALLALFAPRPPLVFKPPMKRRRTRSLSPMAPYVKHFEDPAEREEPLSMTYTLFETPEERRARQRKEVSAASGLAGAGG